MYTMSFTCIFLDEKSTAEVEIKIILYESQCETTDRKVSLSLFRQTTVEPFYNGYHWDQQTCPFNRSVL